MVSSRRVTAFSSYHSSSVKARLSASTSPRRYSLVNGGRLYGAQRSALIIVTEPVPPASRYGLAHASPTGRHRRSRCRSAATQRRRPPVPRCSSAVPPLDGSRGMHTPDLPRLSRSHEAWSAERAPSHGPSSGVRDPQGGQGLAKSTGLRYDPQQGIALATGTHREGNDQRPLHDTSLRRRERTPESPDRYPRLTLQIRPRRFWPDRAESVQLPPDRAGGERDVVDVDVVRPRFASNGRREGGVHLSAAAD